MFYKKNLLPDFKDDIVPAMKKLDYQVFETDTKEYNLNMVGFRSGDNTVNTFNDRMYIGYKYKGVWNVFSYDITTDPGLYYLNQPLNADGTAILKKGQYPKMWIMGLHQGKYEAFTQFASCTVIRDFNRDNYLDYDSGVEQSGRFGINHHRSTKNKETKSKKIDRWSAGCQVAANPNDYYIALTLGKLQEKQGWKHFTYTLLDENDF